MLLGIELDGADATALRLPFPPEERVAVIAALTPDLRWYAVAGLAAWLPAQSLEYIQHQGVPLSRDAACGLFPFLSTAHFAVVAATPAVELAEPAAAPITPAVPEGEP